MNKNTAIKVQNLTKTYKLYNKPIDRLKESLHPLKKKYHKEFYALNNVSFEIKKGETVGIIGKNGSGKSTLLKLITGVTTPTSGKVNIHGKISAILELGAGFNPEMTGLENIYLNNSINGLTKEQTDKRIKDIVDFAELGEFIHQPIKTYSSGMKARLAFAVSINVDPDILIVDEALSVGDAAFARKCFAKMEEIRSKGATILFVSHSEGSIVSLCNRAIWISNGNQIIDGTPKLVTGLYMKHINDSKVDKQAIIKEYEELELQKDEEKGENEIKEKNKVEEDNKNIQTINKSPKQKDFFVPTLKSSSTIIIGGEEAEIKNLQILSLDGREVNHLIMGEEYKIKYQAKFYKNIANVHFGASIKNVQGTMIAGISTAKPKNRNSLMVEKDEEKEIEITFKCNLLPNTYFINCAVRGDRNNELAMLHQLRDSLIFKVLPDDDSMHNGIVNIDMILKIDKQII
ncbi:ABC transporter ATP-binding protein [Aliarcobacter skirrowii]|uniref:ABC transporter ATP-binding protein n=1 Tax=Aliarcobacter skirrowii TaxID=28200 RepID=A0A2U2C154_9BACT|nr:ABC transporter ATP-binding protein [Aliarcobacter skirrowii]PWE21743.1 ABC transporter ATP-binding protein [Aliarcobacter skirrowii]